MKFSATKEPLEKIKTDVLVIPCFQGEKGAAIDRELRRLDAAMNGALTKEMSARKFIGKKDSSLNVFTAGLIPARLVTVAGMGPRKNSSPDDHRALGASIGKAARRAFAKRIAASVGGAAATRFTEGVVLGSYRFDSYKTSPEEDEVGMPCSEVVFVTDSNPKKVLTDAERAFIVSDAACGARDLVNTPAADATPTIIANAAKKLALEHGLEFNVMNEAALKKERMECILAVAKGSAEPPVLVELSYRPRKKSKGHVVIVGKGITFDSGGISLKTPNGMEKMKGDMAGAAAAMMAMKAVAKLKPSVRVTALMPLVENMPDGKALKPGDVVTARNGKTIEIITTDAEGRLVLADALSYALDKNPTAIVDIATLTGGASYCLGELYSIVLGNDQRLVDRIVGASKKTGEPMWQLPIVEEYKKGYTSGIADLNNNGKGKAQTILGAIFLREFIGNVPWAHIDIAASSWTDEDIKLSPRGATGAMTRTMVEFVMGY